MPGCFLYCASLRAPWSATRSVDTRGAGELRYACCCEGWHIVRGSSPDVRMRARPTWPCPPVGRAMMCDVCGMRMRAPARERGALADPEDGGAEADDDGGQQNRRRVQGDQGQDVYHVTAGPQGHRAYVSRDLTHERREEEAEQVPATRRSSSLSDGVSDAACQTRCTRTPLT